MVCSIMTAIAWFFLLLLIAVIVQELEDIRATLETLIRTYRETFVEFKIDETKVNVSENEETRE